MLVVVVERAVEVGRELAGVEVLDELLDADERVLEAVLGAGERGLLLLPEVVRLDDEHVMHVIVLILLQILQYLEYRLHRVVLASAHVDHEHEALLGTAATTTTTTNSYSYYYSN